MNYIWKKIMMAFIFITLALASYAHYHSVRNPVTKTLDFVSENTIGIDLDPIMNLIQKDIDNFSKK
jgi:hypothetical protein